MAIVYVLLLYVLFTVYMIFAIRRYRRWLNDNFADLENKKVWLTHMVTLSCLLLFMLYMLVDINSTLLLFLMHFTELVLFVLLLWRVETLPQLDSIPMSEVLLQSDCMSTEEANGASTPKAGEAPDASTQTQQPSASSVNIDLTHIEKLLAEYCEGTQLYLQHDLTLQQLAHVVGTNRSYLSQYFSCQGITYNTYINNLRINHFISRYRDAAAAGQPIVAQQLASESGYRSYSTFSLAFKQRTGLSVTAWIRNTNE